MMMPILDQSPAHHHHHGHGHQTFFHQQHIPEHTGKMQLTLILPNGVPSVISVDANTPMIDLLVQAASLNKLNPSGYSLVVLDSNQHVIHFKANQTVGQIVKNCQLPQLNGSSMISLLPKEASHPNPSSKVKTRPFEITIRLQVNLPDAQKILIRVDPTLPLYEIKEQICKQKKYTDSNRYTLRLPNKLDQPLSLGLSLAECKTNELTLVHLKYDPRFNSNQFQSFDRLYRTRSESQPPYETVQNEPQEVTNNQQRPASVQLNPTQGQTITSLPIRTTHPITSHTSLHAYWNDPNFDTQSQTSNCSSTTKKRQAPRPPGYITPTLNDQQIASAQSPDHHQSQESLTESVNGTKQKRKAPAVPNANLSDDQQITTIIESQTVNITMDPNDEQRLANLLSEQETPPNAKLVITTNSPTPIYSQIQKTKETIQIESPYSTVKSTPSPPVHQQEEIITTSSPINYSVVEIVQAGIAEPPSAAAPPPPPPVKSTKKSASTDGLTKIVHDHKERAKVYQENSKQAGDVSYFRVAKSRHGKFETDDQGFVNNSSNVFDTNQDERTIPVKDKDEQSQLINIDQLKNIINDKEKSPTPIQLEVTERTTHISVTVESDRKQIITRASPIPQQTSNQPPSVAPKPFGKTITEYRTIRRIGNDGETKTTTTVRTETVPSNDPDNKQSTTENVDQTDARTTNESTQQSGGSENTNTK